MIALLQARTVLTWLRNIQAAGFSLEVVEIVPRTDAEAALTAIGGAKGPDLLARAREVELAIYRISAALMPPDVEEIDAGAVAVYRPFDVIECVRITAGDEALTLRPLVIFDDAHSLHPTQLLALRRWLARRELKVARWILTRLDALTRTDVLLDKPATGDEPGLKRAREITDIWMQSTEDRRGQVSVDERPHHPGRPFRHKIGRSPREVDDPGRIRNLAVKVDEFSGREPRRAAEISFQQLLRHEAVPAPPCAGRVLKHQRSHHVWDRRCQEHGRPVRSEVH